MLLNKVIRVRDKVPQHQHHRQSSSSSNSTAELPSISPIRGVSTPENTYMNVPELILSGNSEHDDIEIDRLALINSSSSRSSSVLAKGFSDTDSGISNAGSSSCESFQSEHYLPDPGKDVLYDDTLIPGTDGIVDFDDDDFTFKLNLSLANLGIGPYGEHIGSGSSANIMLENANMGLAPNNFLVGGAGTSSGGGVGGPFHYSPHFDFNLDELGVDFDIVEPPPAFANSGSEEEKCQLVVDSEAEDPNEIVDSVERHNLTENDVIECSATGTSEEEVENMHVKENEEKEDESKVSALAKRAGVNNSGTCDNLDKFAALAADVSLQNNLNLSLPMEHLGIGRKGVDVGNLRKETRREVKASGSSHSHHHHHQHTSHSCSNRNSSSSNISNGTSGNHSCINDNAGGGSALSSSPTAPLLIPTPPASSSSTSSACSTSSSSVPIARRINNNNTSKPKIGETSGSNGTTGPSATSPSSSSSSSGKKRKRERYEIRIGYLCYELPINTDKHVSIYSLQKNKDMMEDLLGHSKLKNSKSIFFSQSIFLYLKNKNRVPIKACFI